MRCVLGRGLERVVGAAAVARPLFGGLVARLPPSIGAPLPFLLHAMLPQASGGLESAGLERPLRLKRGKSPIPGA